MDGRVLHRPGAVAVVTMSHKPGRDKRAKDKREAMRLERAAYGAMNSNPPTMPPIYEAANYHSRKRLEAFVTRVTKLHWIVISRVSSDSSVAVQPTSIDDIRVTCLVCGEYHSIFTGCNMTNQTCRASAERPTTKEDNNDPYVYIGDSPGLALPEGMLI